MSSAGYSTLQIIPSLQGFEARLDRQLASTLPGIGRTAGGRLGDSMSDGFQTSTSKMAGYARTAAATATVALGAGAVAAGAWGLSIAAANEQAQISFETMLGSASKASAFLGDLRDFAAETPFEFPELQTAASSLISAGVEAGKVIPIMTTLGDVTAGMGTGSEGIRRATVALQQMQAAGRITAEDLNQLRDAGIPVYDLLAAATGRAKSEVTALASAGKLGKTELDQLMGALESGAGLERFSGLMDKQAESLTGLVSTAKDVLGQGLATAMEPVVVRLKDLLPLATSFGEEAMPKVADGLSAALDAGEDFAAWVRPIASDVGEALLPVLEDLVDIGQDSLPTALGIAGGALEAAAAVIVPLAGAVSDVTGFLADHQGVVLAVAGAYAGSKIIDLLEGTGAGFDRLAFRLYDATGALAGSGLGQNLAMIGSGAREVAADLFAVPDAAQRMTGGATAGLSKISAGLKGVANTSVSASTAWTAAFAGIAVGAAGASAVLDSWRDKGRERAEELLAGIELDPTNFENYTDGIQEMSNRRAELLDEMNSGGTGFAEDERLEAQIVSIDEAIEAALPTMERMGDGLSAFSARTGLTTEQIEQLASAAGVDLVGAFKANGEAAPALVSKWEELQEAAKLTGVDMDEALALDPGVLEANAKVIEAAQAAVAAAFSEFGDVLQLTDDPVDPKRLADAREAVAEAEERLRSVRSEGDAAEIDQAREDLEDARQAVEDLLATDSPLDREKIAEFYRDVIADTEEFSANIQRAIEMGYDPQLVSRLLQAGPAEAGPILEQLVGDVTGSYVEMVNAAEREIADLNSFAVEAARLTQIAISTTGAQGQQMSEDLDEVTAISIEMMRSKGQATIEDLARVAGVSEEEVVRIARSYGIEIDKVRTKTQQLIDELSPTGLLAGLAGDYGEGLGNRWGGMYEFAKGGMTGAQMLGPGPTLFKWREPETGGEAFVPRFGDQARSEAIVGAVARDWLGGEFVPAKELAKRTGGGGGAGGGRRSKGRRVAPQEHRVVHEFAGRQVRRETGDEILFGGDRR
jgi:tape measure domain-containing protein